MVDPGPYPRYNAGRAACARQGGAFDPTIDPFGSAPMEPPVPRPDTIDALAGAPMPPSPC